MSSYEIAQAAEQDLQNITTYTLERYGEKQTRKYMEQLENCAEDMATGQGYFKEVDDLAPDIRVKHCQHHYIFGLMRDSHPMVIIAVFHERMDLMVQLGKRLQ